MNIYTKNLHSIITCTMMFSIVFLTGCRMDAYKTEEIFTDKSAIALANAAIRGDNVAIESLIIEGVNPNIKGKKGITALHCAQQVDNYKAMDTLLKNGASPNLLSEHGEVDNVLIKAVTDDSYEQLSLLLSYGGDINLKDSQNQNMINIPIFYDRLAMVKFLVEQGADITPSSEPYQYNAIDDAANLGRYTIVEYLIDKGVNPLIVNNHGRSFAYTVQSKKSDSDAYKRVYAKLVKLGVKFPLPSPPQVFYGKSEILSNEQVKREIKQGQLGVDIKLKLYLDIIPYYLGIKKTNRTLPSPIGERPVGLLHEDELKQKEYDIKLEEYFTEVKNFLN